MTEAAVNAGTGSAGAAGAAAGAQAGAAGQASNGQGANGHDAAGEAKWYAPMNPSKEAADYIEGKGFKNFDDVTKSYRELEGKIAAKGVLIPKDDAPPTEWGEFWKSLGRPDKAEAYAIEAHDPAYQFTDADKALHAELQKAAFEAGLTPKQWQRLNNGYNGVIGKVLADVKEMQAAEQKAGETAIGEWEATIRKNGGDPTKAKALAQTAAQTIIPKDSPLYGQIEKALALDGKPGSGSAAIVDLFHRIGTMMGESGGVLKAGGPSGPLTGPQAQVELDKMTNDPNVAKVLMNPQHANYKATRERWNQLLDTITKEELARAAQGGA